MKYIVIIILLLFYINIFANTNEDLYKACKNGNINNINSFFIK